MNEPYGTTFNVQEQDYYKELVDDITNNSTLSANAKAIVLGWLANIRAASMQRIRKAVVWEVVFYSKAYEAEVSLTFEKLGDIHSQRLFNQRLWSVSKGFKLPKMSAGEWDALLRFLGRLFGDNVVTVETEAEWLDGIFNSWITGHHEPSIRWCKEDASHLANVLASVTTISGTMGKSITGSRYGIENVACIEYKGYYHIVLSNWIRELQRNAIQFTETELKAALHNTGWESKYQLAARKNDEMGVINKRVWRSPIGFELPAMPGEQNGAIRGNTGNQSHIRLIER